MPRRTVAVEFQELQSKLEFDEHREAADGQRAIEAAELESAHFQ